MIAMEVGGGIILFLFIAWEWKLARHPLFRRYALYAYTQLIQYMAAGIFNTYWSSWLRVVDDYSESQWTYICQAGVA